MAGEPPRRRRTVSPDEARIWRAVTRDVAPLPGRTDPGPDDRPAEPQPERIAAPTRAVPAIPRSQPRSPARPPLAPLAPGRAPGVDRRTADRLRRGEMAIDLRLDLHGMTQDSAHSALSRAVGGAYESGRRCLLVITGKGHGGEGVLRRQVPRWLNQSPLREQVLSFSTARQHHGGDGALYVLVKRRR